MMMMMMTMYHAWSINSFSSAASRAQAEAAIDVDVDGRRIENSTQSQPGYPFCECEHNFCTLVWVKYAVFFLFFQYFFVFFLERTLHLACSIQRAALHLLVEVFFLLPSPFPPQGRVLQLFSFLPPLPHRCRHLHLCSLSNSVQFLDWLQWWGCWAEAQSRRWWLGSRAC